MSSAVIDSSIFDSKPLDKRTYKQQNQRELKQKLQQAIEQCLSAYMLTSFKNQFSQNFHQKELLCNSKGSVKQLFKQGNEWEDNYLQFNAKENSVLKQVTYHVQADIKSLASSILRTLKSQLSKKQITFKESSKSNQKLQLTQSNKNFIVELLVELEFLNQYNQTDRSFKRLVNQAQNYYFNQRKKDQEIIQNFQKRELQKRKQFLQQISDSIPIEIQKFSTFYSEERRWKDFYKSQNLKMQKALESGQNVVGYTSKYSDDFICQNTLETSRFKMRLQESLSLFSRYHFITFEKKNFSEDEQKESQIQDLDDRLFAKILERFKN